MAFRAGSACAAVLIGVLGWADIGVPVTNAQAPGTDPGPAARKAAPHRRLALLLANDLYLDADTRLASVTSDTRRLGDVLAQKGFQVDVEQNPSKHGFLSAIDGFARQIEPGTDVLIYFNGFAIQADRQTYLVPVDAAIWSEPDVKREGAGLDALLLAFHRRGARVILAVVDGARANPFERRFRSGSTGLAAASLPDDTLVLFSTGTDVVEPIGSGEPSPFMAELAKAMNVRGADADEVARLTRIGVAHATGGRQVPWVASTLVELFAFDSPTNIQ